MPDNTTTTRANMDLALVAKRGLIASFALVAFAMTVYATSHGARSFLPEIYAWMGVTALAVGFLVFTSFVIGEGVSGGRWGQIVAATPFYLAAVVICWVFSFASYHSQFLSEAGSDLADAETRIGTMEGIPRPLNAAVAAALAQGRARLATEPALVEHARAMEGFAALVEDPAKRQQIRAELNRIEAAALEAASRNRTEAFDARQKALEARDARKGELEALERRIAELDGSIAQAGARIEALKAAMTEEEGVAAAPGEPVQRIAADSAASTLVASPACRRDRAAGRGSGGPNTCFGALEQASIETEKQRSADEAELREKSGLLEKAKFDLDEAQKRLEAAEKAKSEADAQQAEESAAPAGDKAFSAAVAALKASAAPANLEAVAVECEKAVAALRKVEPQTQVPDCRPQAASALFVDLKQREAAGEAFEAACRIETKRKEIVDSLRTKLQKPGGENRDEALQAAFDRMQAEAVTPCIDAADKVGVDTSAVRSALAGFIDRNNPSQDEISKATGKIRDLFSGSASARDYFPALLAILQELSLLAAKLFWDGLASAAPVRRRDSDDDVSDLDLTPAEDDPGPVAAAKNLLRLAVYDRRGMHLPTGFDEEYSEAMRGQMRMHVASLLRRGMARDTRSGVYIDAAGQGAIVDTVRRRQRETSVVAPERPVEAPVSAAPTGHSERAPTVLTVVTGGGVAQRPPAPVVEQPKPSEPEMAEEPASPRRRPRSATIIRPYD